MGGVTYLGTGGIPSLGWGGGGNLPWDIREGKLTLDSFGYAAGGMPLVAYRRSTFLVAGFFCFSRSIFLNRIMIPCLASERANCLFVIIQLFVTEIH